MTPLPSLLVVYLVISALILVVAISMLAVGLFFLFIRFARVHLGKGNSNG